MATTTEVQRLIAVSLGKIAASRSQRGGVNLHRNLLLAGVLHKAKTVYMENYHSLMGPRKLQHATTSSYAALSPTPNPQQPATSSSPAQGESAHVPKPWHDSVSGSRCGSQDLSRLHPGHEELQDKENTPPPSSCALGSGILPSAACVREEEKLSSAGQVSQLGERLVPGKSDYVSNTALPSCGRCVLKRRSSGGQECDSSSPKKARLGETPDCSDTTVESALVSVQTESMQVDPPQINNLVNIFHSGFSGLCARKVSEMDKEQCPISSQPLLSSFTNRHCMGRGSVVMDTSSFLCGSQAMDNRVDSGHHIIALTV